PRHTIRSDKQALLAFRKAIVLDPDSVLANWNEGTAVCNFTGVTCGVRRHRVVMVNLNGSGLAGVLSPVLSNLTQLRYLKLVDNRFFGTIPAELSLLANLRELKLSNNNLQGEIPGSLSLLFELRLIFLNANMLNGTIPPGLFGNCTRLKNVDLSQNELTGRIPAEIGNCPELWNLNLFSNRLVGGIPGSLGNASGMHNLDLENNDITGELPSEMLAKFPDLLFLHLSDNHMVSHDDNTNLAPFFTALENCSALEELEMAGLGLGGSFPSSIGVLGNSLLTFQFQENQICGSIPPEIGNMLYLSLLNLTSNCLNGSIPAEIGKLSLLEQLSLSHNFFTGMPAALGNLSSIGLMDLSHNSLSGEIPQELGDLRRITFLFLNNNLLSGNIPASIGNCISLQTLDLSYNRLTGKVPSTITGWHEMRMSLNLSHNQLGGLLPIELSKLSSVEEIDLSSNNFVGNVFSMISSCYAAKLINFSNNSIDGKLPDTIGDLRSIVAFDVSHNRLWGQIPSSLNRSSTLRFLDFSDNDFSGEIPTGGIFQNLTSSSFLNNSRLCTSTPIYLGIPNCSHKRPYFRSRLFLIIFCIVIFISGFISTICCVIGCQRLRVIILSRKSRKERKQPPHLTQNFPRITYKELLEATEGFDDHRLVGSGSYGRVYRGSLPDGTQIAVKVLTLQTGNSTKSFNRECQVLKRIRHRNLIRIITACSLPEFKALVLPYMANGSLDARLYPHVENDLRSGSSDLNLVQRVNICSDIAEGMAYLHHHSPVKVIHCDLKPSNILLNDDMTALVSDFGIARLVMTIEAGNGGGLTNISNSTSNILCGSVGYIAPEYGFGLSTSTKGDVYSFGVLVLEIVTRKRPTEEMFREGLNLHKYVKNHYHRQMENVVDASLVRALKDLSPEVRKMWEVAIGELIELGIVCTLESPGMRPTMLDCADDLDRLKRYLDGDTTATFSSSLGISSSTFSDC
ncbi:putative leucine-rich repeat receptor-like serine/threonine-protein kinase At2g24130, partial [Andrographis paniculata]|uniref:putative leucine-rich repeat receptor-like serine/threonine-protein kinase At2g24130 n=1 Tax=Andrographis paniculata TaxID=175694 RepID=UPI0021E96263